MRHSSSALWAVAALLVFASHAAVHVVASNSSSSVTPPTSSDAATALRSQVAAWREAEVAAWFGAIGLTEEITGAVLLSTEVTTADWAAAGISKLGHRVKIMDAMRRLQSSVAGAVVAPVAVPVPTPATPATPAAPAAPATAAPSATPSQFNVPAAATATPAAKPTPTLSPLAGRPTITPLTSTLNFPSAPPTVMPAMTVGSTNSLGGHTLTSMRVPSSVNARMTAALPATPTTLSSNTVSQYLDVPQPPGSTALAVHPVTGEALQARRAYYEVFRPFTRSTRGRSWPEFIAEVDPMGLMTPAQRFSAFMTDSAKELGELVQEATALLDRMEREGYSLAQPYEVGPHPRYVTTRGTQLLVSRNKLEHDIDQMRMLMADGRLPAEFNQVIANYTAVINSHLRFNRTSLFILLPEDAVRIGRTYNRFLYWQPDPVTEPEWLRKPLNPDLDVAAIEAMYLDNTPGVTFFDNFLKPEALNALYKFCMETTVFYDTRPTYFGAYMKEGFGSKLLFNIVDQLREMFPNVIGPHELMQMWAYKYTDDIQGIKKHCDDANVNVNFWVTPSDANLDPNTGGLVVYKAQAPASWSFDDFNTEPQSTLNLERLLRDSSAGGVRVPYRQNRMVMFNSTLVHETDVLKFKDGFKNRRINITLLFGSRRWDRVKPGTD